MFVCVDEFSGLSFYAHTKMQKKSKEENFVREYGCLKC